MSVNIPNLKIHHFLLTLLFPASLFAQSNYQPAYVINNSGDTLKGYINYRDWAKSPRTIKFKQDNKDPDAKTFSAADIKGFSISNLERYVSYIGVVSMDKNIF